MPQKPPSKPNPILRALAHRYIHPVRQPVGQLPHLLERRSVSHGLGYELPVFTNIAPGRASDPVYLFIHGYGGRPGVWRHAAEEILRVGRTAAIPAMHGQSISPAKGVSFGLKESQEVIALAEWCREQRPESPVVLIGVSMGGAASWLAAERRPDLFHAVITEGCFSDLETASLDYAAPLPALRPLFRPVMEAGSHWLGLHPSEIRPEQSIRAWRGRRGLIIHSRFDQTFPFSHAEALREASGLPLWQFPVGRHSMASKMRPQEYIQRIREVAGDL